MKSSARPETLDVKLAARVHLFPVAARVDPSTRRGFEFDAAEFDRAVREVRAAAGALRRRGGWIASFRAKWRPRLIVLLSIALLWSAIGLALMGLLSLYVALSR
jgi:hypothetical protein